MKKILISIKPKWVAKILNGEKTIEVRKTAPKCDLPCEVYIYCTKQRILGNLIKVGGEENSMLFGKNSIIGINKGFMENGDIDLQGKVVAKFTLNKVEELHPFFHWCEETKKRTCLERDEVLDYLDSKDKSVGNPKRQGSVYAWRIDKLVIFDNPKELKEFKMCIGYFDLGGFIKNIYHAVEKAPQSWCYCEVRE